MGALTALAGAAALLLLLVLGSSSSGGYDYGIPGLLLTLTGVCAAVAAAHLALASVTRAAGPGGDRRALLVAALAGPVLVVAAMLSGFVSVDWPVLLLGLAATFVPHAVGLLRRGKRGSRHGIPSRA